MYRDAHDSPGAEYFESAKGIHSQSEFASRVGLRLAERSWHEWLDRTTNRCQG
jgi:hypothetical protein